MTYPFLGLIRKAGVIGVFALGPVCSAQGKTDSNATRCSEFQSLKLPGFDLRVSKSVWMPSASDSLSGARLPAYCRLEGVLNERTGADGKEYGIGFAIALPEGWNHDFLMQGGGALNGTLHDPIGGGAAGDQPALARGFAVVSTDTGHKGASAFDATFMKDQQASLDFYYQAIGKVAELSKLIIARYYERTAAFSYYVGCSTGGREAMIMTQRYPTNFDGVVAGAPAMRTGFSNLADRWAAVSLNRIAPKDASGMPIRGGGLSASDKHLVIDALLKQCDGRDGLKDGMIFDVKGCDFNPGTLTCNGAKTDSCLTVPQTDAIKRAFAGPTDSKGLQVYPGFFYDTGIAATKGIPGLLEAGPSPVGPPRSPTEQDVDQEAVGAANPLADSIYKNLSTFSQHGGKLIFYHGVSDPWFSAQDTVEYYTSMNSQNGGADHVMNWSRLYLVPGMGHCGGGEFALDQFDMLTAVVNWVEKSTAPDSVLATGKAFPGRSRPLCAFPKHAQYDGHGKADDSSSFTCQQ